MSIRESTPSRGEIVVVKFFNIEGYVEVSEVGLEGEGCSEAGERRPKNPRVASRAIAGISGVLIRMFVQ